MIEKQGSYKIKRIMFIFLICIGIYFIIGCYFFNHFIIGTRINGINISFMTVEEANKHIKNIIENYNIIINGRDTTNELKASDIDLKYIGDNEIQKILEDQNSFFWVKGILKKDMYTIEDIYSYNDKMYKDKIDNLDLFIEDNIEYPKDAAFIFVNNEFVIVDEVYGNYVDKDTMYKGLLQAIYNGRDEFDLDKSNCYVKPKYYSYSTEVKNAKIILDKYMATKITYNFGNREEVLDSSILNEWIKIDKDMNITINEDEIMNYMFMLSKKYDTVGSKREFKTATGKTVDISGGYYGWKINKKKEAEILKEEIENGEVIEKEPEYLQKGVSREENDIGDTYVEINIASQHLWYYKEGKLVTQGDIVSGGVSTGNATPLGIYSITYKQENATLNGANYSSKVTYWMPFNGNIGIHDASWRYSFGGNIYLSNGTHGCINTPKYLAKKIFSEIEAGTPVICYEDK